MGEDPARRKGEHARWAEGLAVPAIDPERLAFGESGGDAIAVGSDDAHGTGSCTDPASGAAARVDADGNHDDNAPSGDRYDDLPTSPIKGAVLRCGEGTPASPRMG